MVRVIVRPHPESSSSHLVLDQESKGRHIVSLRFPERRKRRSYTVHRALSRQATQTQLFQDALEAPLDQWLTRGRPGALFAYGFTGTGKSYSLFGTPEHPGGIWLTVHYLLERMTPNDDCKLRVSMYEVDGNQVKDLLGDAAELTVRVDEQGSVHLRKENGGPLTRVVLRASEEFQVLWQRAQQSRRVGSSTTHDASSRTHAVVDLEIVDDNVIELEDMVEVKHAEYVQISNRKDTVLLSEIQEAYERDGPNAMINGKPLEEVVRKHGLPHEESLLALSEARKSLEDYKQNAETVALQGSFSIVDMAGNDWEQATTVQTKQAKKEHADINASLLAVKECFRAMIQGKRHVPFRRSRLTQILKRYLGTNNDSNCVMLATIFPGEEEISIKQTMNTLLYASSIATKGK